MSFWSKKRRASKSKKVLTLTYYIEPRNLRMLTISVAKLQAIIGVGAVAAIWGIVSIALTLTSGISKSINDVAKSSLVSVESVSQPSGESQETSSQTKIIETQIKEPKVEVNDSLEKVAAAISVTGETNSETEVYDYDKVLENKIATVYDKDKAQTLKSDLKKLSKESIFALPEQAEIKSDTLDIEDMNWIQKDNELDVKFAIKNSGEGRARGSVYGVADFILENGSKVQVFSHQGINPNLLMANKTLGTMFGARKITYKKLKFKAPRDAKGKFASLKVIMNEDNHSQPLIHAEVVR